jgi:hypothetical protein
LRFGHVLQVDADPRPGAEPSAHRIDEHVSRLQMRDRPGMARLPPLEPGQRILFSRPAADLDQRMLRSSLRLQRTVVAGAEAGRRAPAGRRHAIRLTFLLAVVRRPRRVALALSLLLLRQLEQTLERARMPIDPGMTIAKLYEAGRHRREREICQLADVDLVPRQRRRHARVRSRPHGIRARHRAVLRILVVVEEHAVTLFLPPLARRQIRRSPLDRARESQCGAAYLAEGPAPFDPRVDVYAARARGFRPADEAEVVEGGAHDARHVPDLRPRDARHGVEVDAQLVRMIEIVGADRMRVQLEVG